MLIPFLKKAAPEPPPVPKSEVEMTLEELRQLQRQLGAQADAIQARRNSIQVLINAKEAQRG